ncbi:MAG: ATP-binding protein [Acidobacteria bacterium]|nr:ATP-binding protein [Acidobacteriota bacterium]
MALKKTTGMWVSGEAFFDREFELDRLDARVRNGTHTLLTAQRRMGKTSLVRELFRRLNDEGRLETVFVDLEGAATAADAVAEIVVQARSAHDVWTRLRTGVANVVPGIRDAVDELGVSELRVKLRATLDPGSWRQKGDAVVASLASNERPVVLALDELPMLVNRLLKGPKGEATPEGTAAADEFLSWLRKNGQMYPGRVSMIVSGSVSLEPVLSEAGLTAHANIFAPFELKPWDEETAVACLGGLADGADLVVSKPVRRQVCRLLRCHVPHHVQMFFDCLEEHLRRVGRRRATTEDVERVYAADLLGVRGQLDLDHYESRLRLVLAPEGYRAALALLTEAAVADGWLRREAIEAYSRFFGARVREGAGGPVSIDHLLRLLEHDGYLARNGDDYRFVSGLLEDWWRARHGNRHLPITERSD